MLRDGALRNQQRPAVASQRAAGVEQHVVADAVGVGVIAQLGDVGLAGERGVVERLDVGEPDRELQPFEIDPPVHDRVEHEAVVRARREAQRERHALIDDPQGLDAEVVDRLRQFPRLPVPALDHVGDRAHLRELNLVNQARGHERRALHALDLRVEALGDDGDRALVAVHGVDGDAGDRGQLLEPRVRRRIEVDELGFARQLRSSSVRNWSPSSAPSSARRSDTTWTTVPGSMNESKLPQTPRFSARS